LFYTIYCAIIVICIVYTLITQENEKMSENKESRVVVLIPAYNPDKKMTSLIKEMNEAFEHIVVVNDGCTSEFMPLFEEVDGLVSRVNHEVNKGKGQALKTGFEYILNNIPNSLGVVTVDADGQHTVKDTLNCCKKFLDNPKTGVFGCRDFTSDSDIPPRSRFGNRLTSRLMKFFCDIELSDTQTGLRVLPTSCLKDMLEVPGERYEYEMNMIFALKDLGIGWVECPISVIYLDNNESSHFNPIKDSLKIYKVFLKFCISSFGSSLLDLIVFTIAAGMLSGVLPATGILSYIVVSTVIARVCSGVFNYSFNRWIFGGKSKVGSSGPKYLAVWFVQMSLSAGIVGLISAALPAVFPTLIKVIVDTILFFISYKIQQKWVFKK